MPALRLASAPNRKPIGRRERRSRGATPSHGFQPRFRPFVFPFVTTLPSAKPAMPKIAIWQSETIPPYAERKIRLAAAMPRKRACVRMKLTQKR